MNDYARLCLLKTFLDTVTPIYNQLRAGMRDDMTVGDRRTAVLEDGTEIGAATHVHGRKPELGIVDEDAFLEWCKDEREEWLELKVQDKYRQQAIEMVRSTGVATPGIGWKPAGSSYVMAKVTPQQKALVLERLRNGEFRDVLDGPVTALTAGPRDE